MSPRLFAGADGGFAVEGDLGFDSVPVLLQEAERLFRNASVLRIDLAGVTRSDSSGVALLLEWLRQARAQGLELCLVNVPPQMRAIISVADLEELLPVA